MPVVWLLAALLSVTDHSSSQVHALMDSYVAVGTLPWTLCVVAGANLYDDQTKNAAKRYDTSITYIYTTCLSHILSLAPFDYSRAIPSLA